MEYDQEELRQQPQPRFLSIENIFTEDDKDNIRKNELEPVSSFGELTDDALLAGREKAASKNRSLGSRSSSKKLSKDDKEQMKSEIESIKKYMIAIDYIIRSRKFRVQGEGIRRYKQPKRNACKITNSQCGGLLIDVPLLTNRMKLNTYRGGKLVYQADADRSLINLLTKRFNPKTKYSLNATRIFSDLCNVI